MRVTCQRGQIQSLMRGSELSSGVAQTLTSKVQLSTQNNRNSVLRTPNGSEPHSMYAQSVRRSQHGRRTIGGRSPRKSREHRNTAHVISPTSDAVFFRLKLKILSMITRAFVRGRIQSTRFAVRTATRLSYAKGADTPPLSDETLPSFYEKELLAKFATRPALVSRHEPVGGSGCLRWSYEELWRQANDLARGLLGLGVTKGSRVGVVMGNNRYDVCGKQGGPSAESVLEQCLRPTSVGLFDDWGYPRHYKPCVQSS